MAYSRRLLTAGFIGFAAVLSAPFLMPDPAPEANTDITSLFDPLTIAANLCRGSGATTNPWSGTRRMMSRFGAHAAATGENGLPKLIEGVGTNHLEITTSDPVAQLYFDQGLRFTYGFNHPQAILAFRAAQQIDPDCALCYWGEALSWGPNINAPMNDRGNALALQALGKAQAKAADSSPKERALIAAMATRYADAPDADRGALDKAYAEAMSLVATDYPDDLNIAVMYAEALMDTQPWDYWESDLTTPKPATAQTLAALHRVLKADPKHMGAIHLYIHITEASTNATWAEPYADELGALAPASGHLVHMPSHTYYRLGRFRDSLQANIDAAIADEALIAATSPAPNWDTYAGSYYPHNVHFLLTSAHMAGDRPNTLASAAKLGALVPDSVLAGVPWTHPIKAAPYYAYLHYGDLVTVMALPAPPYSQPYVKAAWHFARGSVLARAGDITGAKTEGAAISALRDNADFSFLETGGVPASTVLKIEENLIKGHIARAEGDLNLAIDLYTAAMRLEIALPYTEPPYWYYPVRQTLGAALVQAGRYDDAIATFTTSLIRVPNNGWALYGLAEAQRAKGDQAAAAETDKLLSKAWVGDLALLTLGNL